MTQKHIAEQALLPAVVSHEEEMLIKVAKDLKVEKLTEFDVSFVRLALRQLEASREHMVSWLELAKAVREMVHGKDMKAMKKARRMLESLGYHKAHVSQITKVADSKMIIWKDYEGKLASFRTTLERTRIRTSGVGLGVPEKERNMVRSFVHKLFRIGAKEPIMDMRKVYEVDGYEVTVVKKEASKVSTKKQGVVNTPLSKKIVKTLVSNHAPIRLDAIARIVKVDVGTVKACLDRLILEEPRVKQHAEGTYSCKLV